MPDVGTTACFNPANSQSLTCPWQMAGETKALIADTKQSILETVRVIEAVEQETRLVETQSMVQRWRVSHRAVAISR